MEKLKAKHDHKLTDILKVFIFALFLMMPFLTYMPNALYYGCNEYAKNETSTQVDIQYKYQSNEVNSVDDLIEGNIYNLSLNNIGNDYIDIQFYLLEGNLDVQCNEIDADASEWTFKKDTTLLLTFNAQNKNITAFYDIDGTYIEFTDVSSWYTHDLVILLIQDNGSEIDDITQYFSVTDYNEIESVDVQTDVENTITESMQHAWQRMWQSQMYNWTNESVLKQGLDNFTGVFGVSDTSYFTNLLVYELIMLAIYVVIDIVITLFTWLTHLIGEK